METVKKRSKIENFGTKRAVKKFSQKNQPTSAEKKAGWAKKKTLRELANLVLVGNDKVSSGARQMLMETLGIDEATAKKLTFEEGGTIQQLRKALSGDTAAWSKLQERLYGSPKQEIEMGGKLKIIVKLNKPE